MDLKMKKTWKCYKKGKNILLSISLLIGVLVVIYSLLWMSSKKSNETSFLSTIEKTGFQFDEELKYYTKEIDGINYYVPNQKMPAWNKFKLDFMAKYVRSELITDTGTITVIVSDDSQIALDFSNIISSSIYIEKNGNIISPNVSSSTQIQYDKYKDEICSMAYSTYKIFQTVYKL